MGNGTGMAMPALICPRACLRARLPTWQNLYAEVLGIVSQSQVMYTRSGPNLTLNPTGDPISIHAIVPSYNSYLPIAGT